MNARTQIILTGLLLGLTLLMLAGSVVWSLNSPIQTPLATAALTAMASLFAQVLLAAMWVIALLILREQGRATVSLRWLIPGALALLLPGATLWAALTLRSAPLAAWGLVPELAGLLPLFIALLIPLLIVLTLGALALDVARAAHPPADAALPAYWSAASLTAEDLARETAQAEAAAPASPEARAAKARAAAQAPASPDDLTAIKGIGPKTAAALVASGIDSFAALASASPEEIVRILRANGIRPGDVEAWRAEAAQRQSA